MTTTTSSYHFISWPFLDWTEGAMRKVTHLRLVLIFSQPYIHNNHKYITVDNAVQQKSPEQFAVLLAPRPRLRAASVAS
jgi:hypothetical protein